MDSFHSLLHNKDKAHLLGQMKRSDIKEWSLEGVLIISYLLRDGAPQLQVIKLVYKPHDYNYIYIYNHK